MAKTKTLLELRNNARQLADMVGSNFITDVAFNAFINDSIDEFWDLVVIANEGYGQLSTTLTVAGGAISANLPSDFYKLRGVDDLNQTPDPITVHPYNFAERNDFTSYYNLFDTYPVSRVTYALINNTIEFRPTSNAPGNYRIHYIPVAPTLTLDTDTIDAIAGWHDLIQVDTAIKALQKEEASTTVLERRKASIIERMEKMVKSRDMGRPRTVTNVRSYSGIDSLYRR